VAFRVVEASSEVGELIRSDLHKLKSNEVLARVRPGLESAGFVVEAGRGARIKVPVLFGRQGRPSKSFHADRTRAVPISTAPEKGATTRRNAESLQPGRF
jgi:hypothetical protein